MTIALVFMDGFDHWASNPTASGRDYTVATNQTHAWALAGTTISGVEFDPGRYTADSGLTGTYAIRLKADANDDRRLATVFAVADSNSQYAGFNAKLGVSTAVTATGFHRFCGWGDSDVQVASGGSANHKLTFLINANSGGVHSLHLVQGVPLVDNSGGSPTILATGLPTRECWNTWTYFEVGLYRSATSGTVDMWIETATGGLENVIHYAGDTSVATVGTINRFYMSSARQGGVTAGQTSNLFDDFWLATGGRVGVPAYVMPSWPASDVTGASATGFVPVTGTDNYAQIIHPVPAVITGVTGAGPFVNYISTTYAATGAEHRWGLFHQPSLAYTPDQIFGVECIVAGFRAGVTSGICTSYAVLRKGSTDITGTGQDFLGTSDGTTLIAAGYNMRYVNVVAENDPDTATAWTPATANALSFGIFVTGATAAGQAIKVHTAVTLVLQSIEVAAAGSGGGGAGSGWPFWLVNAG